MKYTLKLDASWKAIEIIDSYKAFNMVFSGRANTVEKHKQELAPGINFPSVVVLKKYIRKHPYTINCNRKNVLWRDNNTCQYCSKKYLYYKLTLDHIIPKSRGGNKTWVNLVACCKKCNLKKNNLTPTEANMSLIRLPQKPKPTLKDVYRNIPILNDWLKFL